MLITDRFINKFYDVIKKKNVVIMTSVDTDSLCSVMILTQLLKFDDVPFTVRAVEGWESVKACFEDFQDQQVSLVMINCGGTKALSRFTLPEQSKVFVIDSHRPFNIENVFDPDQIYILVDSQELEDLRLPQYEEVMDENSDEESADDESDDEEHVSYEQRMEKIQRKAIKREEKRLWERRKQNLLWTYYESTWMAAPTSVRLLEIIGEAGKMTAESLWFASIGLNSSYVDNLISVNMYTNICLDRLRLFVHRYAPKNIVNQGRVDDMLHITFEQDLPLALYSQWDLENAMRVDEFFAIETKNWTQKGDSNMKQLLSNMGILLNETKQKFGALATERRNECIKILEEKIDSKFGTFFCHMGYAARLSAFDVARAATIRLEVPKSKPAMNRFMDAQRLLKSTTIGGRENRQMLNHTFETSCQRALLVIWKTVAAAINQSEVISNGPLYLYSCSRPIDEDMVQSRHFLYVTTSFMLKAFASMRRGRETKPLIAMFPLNHERSGWLVVTGVMPLGTSYDDNLLKTCIGRAFERVKKMSQRLRIEDDSFNSDIIYLKSEDRTSFLGCLEAIFETANQ